MLWPSQRLVGVRAGVNRGQRVRIKSLRLHFSVFRALFVRGTHYLQLVAKWRQKQLAFFEAYALCRDVTVKTLT
jgi:hypothetical protein